jgi:hypothetical protein
MRASRDSRRGAATTAIVDHARARDSPLLQSRRHRNLAQSVGEDARIGGAQYDFDESVIGISHDSHQPGRTIVQGKIMKSIAFGRIDERESHRLVILLLLDERIVRSGRTDQRTIQADW